MLTIHLSLSPCPCPCPCPCPSLPLSLSFSFSLYCYRSLYLRASLPPSIPLPTTSPHVPTASPQETCSCSSLRRKFRARQCGHRSLEAGPARAIQLRGGDGGGAGHVRALAGLALLRGGAGCAAGPAAARGARGWRMPVWRWTTLNELDFLCLARAVHGEDTRYIRCSSLGSGHEVAASVAVLFTIISPHPESDPGRSSI